MIRQHMSTQLTLHTKTTTTTATTTRKCQVNRCNQLHLQVHMCGLTAPSPVTQVLTVSNAVLESKNKRATWTTQTATSPRSHADMSLNHPPSAHCTLHRQTNRQSVCAHRQTGTRQTDRQTAHRQTSTALRLARQTETDKQTHRQRPTDSHTRLFVSTAYTRQTDRQRTDRQADIHSSTACTQETDKQTDRQTETDRQTDRQTETDR
jgi:hypothetical protein